MHSVYKWEDTNFAQFMIALMKTLEPRRYRHGEVIHGELEEVQEVQFIVQGSFLVGFEVNKKRQMKLHFPPGCVIGAYNVLYNQ